MTPTALVLTLLAFLAPPSGRPPEGPILREDPRIHDVVFRVQIHPPLQYDQRYQVPFTLKDTPIVMPMIFMSTYSIVDPESLEAHLWLDGIEDLRLRDRSRLDEGYPFSTQMAVMPVAEFEGQSVKWEIAFRVQTWSSRVSDESAAQIAWPREWPEEAADGLRPQMYIQSDAPVFKETVDRISEGNLNMVPPYLAAKDIVRYCILNVRVSGDGMERRNLGMIHGMQLSGALAAAERGLGSPHDLVCVCVAMLRAAGIPARPVIGVEKKTRRGLGGDDGAAPVVREREEFVSWAEFYLPGAGWIPFDPVEMGNRVRSMNVRQQWSEFGTMDDLNDRVPLAFHFIPPASVEVPEFPAVWGWDPRPARPPLGAEQSINLSIIDRGRGPG